MTIAGVGVDLSSITRWKKLHSKWGDRLCERVFDRQEWNDAKDRVESLAARWAAKEALAKALGSGLKFHYQDVAVRYGENKRPLLELKDSALTLFKQKGGGQLHVSLSHEQDVAIAFVIWEIED